MSVGNDEPTAAYPDLPIPAFHFRNVPARLSQPRVPAAAVTASTVVAVASLGMASPWQQVCANAAAVLGILAGASVLARSAADRRQHSLERSWLATQTEALRQHAFEALRCTVRGRHYDLASAADVRDLRDQSGDEPAAVSFAYLAGGRVPSIGEVHRRLRDVTFVTGAAAQGRAFVRFPQARYLPRPRRGGWPARRTSWALDGPVLVSVAHVA